MPLSVQSVAGLAYPSEHEGCRLARGLKIVAYNFERFVVLLGLENATGPVSRMGVQWIGMPDHRIDSVYVCVHRNTTYSELSISIQSSPASFTSIASVSCTNRREEVDQMTSCSLL